MIKHKVVKWVQDEDDLDTAITALGGFFQKGMRWKDYIKIWNNNSKNYIEAIRKSVVENNIKITGELHQNSYCGVPMFENMKVASFSFRAWGDLMAAIWSTEENTDYCYMDFYC